MKTNPSWTVRDTAFSKDGRRIFARLYVPEGKGPFPTVILAHGFGMELSECEPCAMAFAGNGIAACCFDFIGGGKDSRSGGRTEEMSVLTEAADMNAVLDGIRELPETDSGNIFLMGLSQGAFVATYTAADRPEDVRGLIAVYPAYVLQDDARKRTPDPDAIPETIEVMGVRIGRIYSLDAMSFDIYEKMPAFERNVLIIHGTADPIAPISYSERAVQVFPHAELLRVEGAGHAMREIGEEKAAACAVRFVQENSGMRE